jgi:hypothetical protein
MAFGEPPEDPRKTTRGYNKLINKLMNILKYYKKLL